jgi:hypothetical protein
MYIAAAPIAMAAITALTSDESEFFMANATLWLTAPVDAPCAMPSSYAYRRPRERQAGHDTSRR